MRRLYRFVISSPLALLTVACGSAGFNDTDPIDVSDSTEIGTAASALTGQPTRAMILIDSRLGALSARSSPTTASSERRRGFSIALNVVSGLDDMGYAAVGTT